MGPEQANIPERNNPLLLARKVCEQAATLRHSDPNASPGDVPGLKEAFRQSIESLQPGDDQLMDLWSYFLLASYAAKELYLERFPPHTD